MILNKLNGNLSLKTWGNLKNHNKPVITGKL